MPTDTFECQICCENLKEIVRNKTQKFACTSCQFAICVNCQKRYAKGECMNCHMTFKLSYLRDRLGVKFISDVIKPQIYENLLREQEQTLSAVQPLVEWEKQIREQKNQARFGLISPPVTRPKSAVHKLRKKLPCPENNCRGFIQENTCGVCSIQICLRCQEKTDSNHLCRVEVLQSLALINQDSKACPHCNVLIYKIAGCNHMYCTNCLIHFDWMTGDIMTINQHTEYLRNYFQQIEQERQTIRGRTDGECFSLENDRVALNELSDDNLDADLIRSLYGDSNSIRLLKQQRYCETEIVAMSDRALEDLQVKYLLNEIERDAWGRQIYRITNKKNSSMLIANVLNLYLSTIDTFQIQLKDNDSLTNQQKIKQQLNNLIHLCNDSFDSLYEEEGGVHLHFRNVNDSPDLPAYIG